MMTMMEELSTLTPVKLPQLAICDYFSKFAGSVRVDPHRPIAWGGFLDKKTGQFVPDYDPEDASWQPKEVQLAADHARQHPERFVPTPSDAAIDPDQYLRRFLSSHWTDDDQLRRDAQHVLDEVHGDSFHWGSRAPEEAIEAWHKFLHAATMQRARAFWRLYGFDPEFEWDREELKGEKEERQRIQRIQRRVREKLEELREAL